ncbi:Fe-S cluster assembly scaffold protein SufA [Methylacidimicrobium sp. AP8]|uniref:HesB/IscA family protein n=1 Tax=Methylacidimicrobium sp. AP8 TaxID=2730359 RepID=UPI0018C087DF|nr:iron-sulfur cluster biosynthesis family protein [Methylacidimicrobium sp. AP8]CAB4243385.1 Fe-S cluster assembly scaffold protein SufA [Methylacidimicrobium sp. AP8]
MKITLTPKAQAFIKKMTRMGTGGRPGGGLRLRVQPGGCSGLSTEFTVELGPREGDAVWEGNGCRIFVPAESRPLLREAILHFVENPMETRLIVLSGPTGSCACSQEAAAGASGASAKAG